MGHRDRRGQTESEERGRQPGDGSADSRVMEGGRCGDTLGTLRGRIEDTEVSLWGHVRDTQVTHWGHLGTHRWHSVTLR